MRQATQIQLIRRVLSHASARTTDMDPDAVSSPVARYIEPERLAAERRTLFRELPLAVAHRCELSDQGSFITRRVPGGSLLLTRGEDGELRGFHNVCRHRGTRLVDAPCGKKKAFICPYHAWTYDSRGRLLSVRHDQGFAGDVQRTRGLAEVAVKEAFGFIWVQLDGDMPDIAAYLGDVADDLEALDLASHSVYRPRTLNKPIGWKLALDIFLEGYHVTYAHRRTIAPMFIDNVNLFDRFEPHMRAVLPKKSITSLADEPEESWRLRPHANVLYLLFPNTLVLVQPDHAGIFHIFPDTVSESRIEAYTLVPEPAETYKARRYWDRNLDILYTALAEDFGLGESIQEGLASGANEEMLFGRYEQSLAWFHDSVDKRSVRARTSAVRAPAQIGKAQ